MEQNDALDLYRRTGAYLEGHFRLSSGLHSPGYMQSALVLQHPADAASLGQGIAAHAKRFGATVVLSPALGGLIIGHEVARALGVRAIFAERAGGTALTLRRGFTFRPAIVCLWSRTCSPPASRRVRRWKWRARLAPTSSVRRRSWIAAVAPSTSACRRTRW